MEKLVTYGMPCLVGSRIAIYWAVRLALTIGAITLWLLMFLAWLCLVWFIKGAPPRLVMRYF